MIELLNSLEWPGVFAVVGSVVTIVTGLFGYLLAARRNNITPPQVKILSPEEYEKLHARINEAVNRIAVDEGDIKEIRASLRAIQKQLHEHEQRDITDFKLVDAKIERLMDIVVRILQDDRL